MRSSVAGGGGDTVIVAVADREMIDKLKGDVFVNETDLDVVDETVNDCSDSERDTVFVLVAVRVLVEVGGSESVADLVTVADTTVGEEETVFVDVKDCD